MSKIFCNILLYHTTRLLSMIFREFAGVRIIYRAPLITHRAASDEKIFRQSKQKAARIVDPIRRIFVTNDGKDSVDSL
ncbi:MAG: hypothetical protein IKM33_00815, partial [Clostridia bacterium]|nr:hypothetical protein [Clostridia bacterium]